MICSSCGTPILIGDWPLCPHGSPGAFWSGDAQIHTSEKVTVFENAQTGDVKIPGRADRPMHPKLAAAGYVRRQLDHHSDINKLERKKGLIHEPGNFDKGSATAERQTGSV